MNGPAEPLTVVTWRWKPPNDYRSKFGPQTVNVLRRMVARHYPHPHRFLCVTDDPVDIDPEVHVLADFGDFCDLPSPHDPERPSRVLVGNRRPTMFDGRRYPSCYRRLRLFHPDAAQWFGPRFVSLDLDMVITGDLSPLWNRTDDFVMCQNFNPQTNYNGSMIMLRAGARPQVWTDFDRQQSPAKAKAAGQHGSDQGWISYRLGKGEKTWTQADGVYSYRNHIRPNGNRLPPDARIVVFHGLTDPWTRDGQEIPWVREHYQ